MPTTPLSATPSAGTSNSTPPSQKEAHRAAKQSRPALLGSPVRNPYFN